MPGALNCLNMSPSNSVILWPQLFHAVAQELRLHKLCVTQGFGIADPSVDDSSTGRGIVLGRAATKLRSIEIQPLTGGSTSHRLVDLRCGEGLMEKKLYPKNIIQLPPGIHLPKTVESLAYDGS